MASISMFPKLLLVGLVGSFLYACEVKVSTSGTVSPSATETAKASPSDNPESPAKDALSSPDDYYKRSLEEGKAGDAKGATIDGLIRHFQQVGLKAEKMQPKLISVPGKRFVEGDCSSLRNNDPETPEGVKLRIDSDEIFTVCILDKRFSSNLEKIKLEGGFAKMPAVVNGTLVLFQGDLDDYWISLRFRKERNPKKWEEIKKAFQRYKP